PGNSTFWPRLEIVHVLIIPAALAVLITLHLAMIMRQHHSQFPGRGRRERNVVGTPMWPAYALRSLGLFFAVAAVLFALGGLIQINPIWQWGPFEPYLATNGAQPDWYLGWLIGALRLMPSFDVTIGHFTLIPNPFWGGVLFPLFVLGVLAAFPWIERRLTGDHGVHNLADRPRDAPNRTAFGVAFLFWVFAIFGFGAADRILVLWNIGYNTQLYIFRIGIWVIPVILFVVVRRICRDLQDAERVDAIQRAAEQESEHEHAALAGRAPP
ncbi:MAG TPA: cytochrome b N-terminal domain-containing protein, partial [Solirubrobacteraceae bacterium]